MDGRDAHNTISGGVFFGAVIQGQYVTVDLPEQVTPALSGLPAHSAGFTGRREALDALLALLDPASLASGARAVACSVAGLAGVGKTELAVQAAHAALERGWFPGGVLFVDLYGYDQARRMEPGAALDGLLRALGLPAKHIPFETQDRARLYASILAEFAKQGQRILVVVDNASSAEQARPLLPTDGVTGAVITSRHTLADLDARLMDLDVLDPQDAVDLLEWAVATARGAEDPRFAAERAAAAQVAERCGYLPLALRIVSALLAEDLTRPLAAMAADLSQERTRLDELRYEERAVRGAFELSYRQLDPEQARVFRFLPVNPGPDLDTETAAVLANSEQRTTRHALEALARAHLVERGTLYGRWRMHDLVRIYADEPAADDRQARDAALDRLLEHYRDTTYAADAHWNAPPGYPAPDRFRDAADALAWLDREYANLIAAVTLAANSGRVRAALSLSGCLTAYLSLRRHFDEAIDLGQVAVLAARQVGDRNGEGTALSNFGGVLLEARQFDAAVVACGKAVEIYEETGDRHGEASAYNNLGLAFGDLRKFEEAVIGCRQAAFVYLEIGDWRGAAGALTNYGMALGRVHEFDEALIAHQQAVGIFHDMGDRNREGTALGNLGLALADVRRFEEAVMAHEEAVAIFRETADRNREGTALGNLGPALLKVHRTEEAVTAHEEAVAIFRETGDRNREGTALGNLGQALSQVSRFDDAIGPLEQGVAICRETGDRRGEAGALTNLGLALTEVHRLQEALAAHQQAAGIYADIDDRNREGNALNNLGTALADISQLDEALSACRQAADIFRETNDRRSEGMALNNLGTTLGKARRFDDAIVALEQAAAIYRETGDKEDESTALSNLDIARKNARAAARANRRR